MSHDAKKIGARIKRLRRARGLTQTELAKILQTGPTSVNLWETGRHTPNLHSLTKLAAHFKVDIEFISGEGNQRLLETREKALAQSLRILESRDPTAAQLNAATNVIARATTEAEKAAADREEQFQELMDGAHERLLRKLARLKTQLGYDDDIPEGSEPGGSVGS